MALASILLLAALLLFALALRLRRTTGIPWARVVASDMGRAHVPPQPLVAARYHLRGRPDYLLQTARSLIPVEVKPGRTAPRPYESDMMQLAAYCLLVEEQQGAAPPYGLLRYADATFRVAYTAALRARLLDTLEDMRAARDDDDCPRSHDQPQRCAGCGFVDVCDDALVE